MTLIEKQGKPDISLVRTSEGQKDVLKVVENVCKHNNLEVLTEHSVGLYVVDVLIKEKNLAIEVEGPHHYGGKVGRLNQKSRAKERYLKAKGFEPVHFNLREMYSSQSKETKEELIMKQLKNYL